jgi:hypothetical protein
MGAPGRIRTCAHGSGAQVRARGRGALTCGGAVHEPGLNQDHHVPIT